MLFKFYDEGHAWIIDGGRRTTHSSGNFTTTYVHCNMGWDGKCDGYYLNAVFDTTVGPAYKDINDVVVGTSDYNFKYDIEYAVISR